MAEAQQLGQTKEEIVAQNGAAVEENHGKGTAVYRNGQWKSDVTYADGVAKKLTVTKTDSLTEDEIRSVLAKNAAGTAWHEIGLNGGTRMWQRSDLATAQCDRVKPRSIGMTDSPLRHSSAPARVASIVASNAARTIFALASPIPSNIPPRTSLPNRIASAAPRSASTGTENILVNGIAMFLAGCVFLVVPIAVLAVFFKLILPLLLKRGVKTVVETVMKVTSTPSVSRAANPTPLPPQSTYCANPPPLPKPTLPTLALKLEDMSWENFELLAGEIFRRQGFNVQITSGLGADGGIDLRLRRDGEVTLVQCKHFHAENKVSVSAVREFYGILVAEGAKRGIFMTTGLYSRDGCEFAEGKPIELLGRPEIEELMASVVRPNENLCIVRNWIDDFAAGASITDPNCPRCRLSMKLKRGVTGRAFWGCSSFPLCRGKRDARTDLVQAYSYQRS